MKVTVNIQTDSGVVPISFKMNDSGTINPSALRAEVERKCATLGVRMVPNGTDQFTCDLSNWDDLEVN